jgi:endoglucanase
MSLRRPSAAKWRGAVLGALLLAAISISTSFPTRAQALPTAPQVASQINLGWNLGNTLEAICGETAWGNPATTQALINSVKAAGFNAIRIPVSWNCHITDGTTTIPSTWMTRVKQVVDMAIGQNMYVIINIHWDGGWLQDHVTFADQAAVNARQNALWTQIANTFKTYDQHLMFAGTNEVHADYGTPTSEHITVQQSYNQTFVNAVRATGGNNASRTLVVQTYNTNVQHGLNFFSLPSDTAASRLMVEVHNYDPYDFTINPNGACNFWGAPYPDSGGNCNWAYESYFDNLFAQVKSKWIDQGVPVILGEYGVETRAGKSLDARAYWNEYVNRAAARNGIKTFYWDNGAPSTGNTFRIFDRATGAIVDQAVLDAILRGSGVGNSNQSYTLTTAANGSGTVSRNPTGTTFPGGTSVTLTATPAAGNQFAGWTGDASGATNPITVRILGNTTVTGNFLPQGTGGSGTILREYWLNVSGNTVASLTGNANYPNSPTGSEQLTTFEGPTNAADNYGSRVRGYVHPPITGAYTFWIASDDASDLLLSTNDNPANAARIAFVSEWTDSRQWTKFTSQRSASINLVGGQKYYIEAIQKEATGGDNLAVSWQGPGMAQAVIPGNFLSPFVPTSGGTFALSVTRAGAGSGTVTSSPAGINCGSTCSASYNSGVTVTLTAAAASGSSFAGWSGACTGTGACTVSMTATRAVTASFNAASSFSLAVTRAGTGTGTVTSSPTGINCGSTCTANFASGTAVTLSAAAASGSAFAGWSGACTGTSTCALSMTAPRNVTATFNTSGGTGGTCANPITFTGNTGNFNTNGAACYRTNANINGWGCSNFDGRTVTVGGVARTCGQLPLTRSADGYYYFAVTAGTYAWASLYYW